MSMNNAKKDVNHMKFDHGQSHHWTLAPTIPFTHKNMRIIIVFYVIVWKGVNCMILT